MSHDFSTGRRAGRISPIGLAVILGAAAALTGVEHAAADTWDASSGVGGWSTNINWADNTEPTSADPVIFPTPFPMGVTNIALSSGEQAASITLNDNYLLGGGNVTLSGSGGVISVASGKTATIRSSINGSVGLTKSGTGTLFLQTTGSNGFVGAVNITGTLSITKDSCLGNAANTVLIGPGVTTGTLQSTLSLTTSRTISPGILGGTISANSGTQFTINGALGGVSNPITFNGLGTVVLGAASTRNGSNTIQNGTVRLNNGAGLGTLGSTVSSNGRLEVGAGVTTNTFTSLQNTGTVRSFGAGAVHNGGINVAGAAAVFLDSGDTSAHTLTIGDYDGGSGSTTLVKGSGTVIVSGAGNSYTGQWAVNTGTLRLAHVDALTTSSSPITVASTGTVIAETASNYAGGWTVDGLLRVQNATGLGVGVSDIPIGTLGTLQIEGVNVARNLTLSGGATVKGLGNAAESGTITAANSVPIVTLATGVTSTDALTISNYTGGSGSTTHIGGAGEVILSNANTYGGNWEIDTGSLRVDNAGALGSNSTAVLVDGGTVHLHGPTITRNITMNNLAALRGSSNGATTGRSNGTLSISPGAVVSLGTLANPPTGLVIGDSANDLTGGGAGSAILITDDSSVTLGSSSNYVGNWIVQGVLQSNSDNRLGDVGNAVTLESGAFVSFSPFTTSRPFIIKGDSQIQCFFSGPMTFNSGLTGTFNTLEFLADQPIILNAPGTLSGTAINIKATLKVNHNQGAGSVPFNVLGFASGVLELGGNVTLSQPATMFHQSILRGNNNAVYNGTISVKPGGDDVTLATGAPGDVFTIGNNASDLTGGGSGSVITVAGPGKIVLPHATNVIADWNITGGILTIDGGIRVFSGSFTAGGGALEISNATVSATPLTLNNNGALRATGVGHYTNSGYPQVTNALASVSLTAVGASDRLELGSAIRSVTAAPSTATINVNGAGRVVLAAGGTTATDVFGGSWLQSSGILQVGQTAGNSINGLGFKNGDARQANSIRLTSGSMGVGVLGGGANTPPWLRANVTLAGGAIGSTNGVNAQYGGDFIIEAGLTSRVLLFDPASPGTVRDVSLVAGNPGTDNNAALTHWRANSTLIVDPGTTTGGVFTIARDGGTINVAAASPTLQINPGATVVLAGTVDALSEGTKHVNVVNNSPTSFNVTQGDKSVGTLSGTGNTTISAGASLTIHQNGDSSYGNITGAGALIKEGAGTLAAASVDVGSLTINGGAVSSSSSPSIGSGETITVAGGQMSATTLLDNGTLNITSGTLELNLLSAGNDGTLTGGTDTGNVFLSGGTVSAKKVLLGSSSGGNGNLTVSGTGTLECEKLSANDLIVNGGTVTVTLPEFVSDEPILDGAIVAGYVHDGAVIINGGSVTTPYLKVGVTAGHTGTYTQTGGSLTAGSILVGSAAGGTGSFNWSGGTRNVQTLAMTGAAQLGVSLASATLGTGYSQLQVSGNATLAGTLNITRTGGFEPQLGDSFVIITHDARIGQFEHVAGLSAGPGKVFSVQYNPSGVTLLVSTPIAPDLDQDDDVDGDDWTLLGSCTSRDHVPHNGTALCQAADFDHDNDVDMNDFGVFQRCYGGTNVPPAASCID